MTQVVQLIENADMPNKFGMSSTTYASGNKEVFAADVTGCIRATASEAQENPVDIYIERLAVKLRVTGLDDYTSQMTDENGNLVDATYNFVDTEGNVTAKKLQVTLTGWQVRNTYAQCKVIKDLGDVTELDTKFPGFLWNAEAYHRSFWAVTPAHTSMLRNPNFNIYDNAQFTLTNYDAAAPTKNIQYVYPNTAYYDVPATNDVAGNWGKPLSNRMTKCTGIVIRGVVHLEGETDGLDMVNWAGQYHTMADFKAIVANTYNGEDGVETKVTADQIGLQQITGKNLYVATVNGNVYDRITNIEWWKDGVTSFYINIQHDKYLKDGVETPLFGLVRNHIYNTAVTNVIGLGVPGNEIENPDKDKETYLAARINVLNWKLVSNSVVLE